MTFKPLCFFYKVVSEIAYFCQKRLSSLPLMLFYSKSHCSFCSASAFQLFPVKIFFSSIFDPTSCLVVHLNRTVLEFSRKQTETHLFKTPRRDCLVSHWGFYGSIQPQPSKLLWPEFVSTKPKKNTQKTTEIYFLTSNSIYVQESPVMIEAICVR